MTREEAITVLGNFKRYISGGGVTSRTDTEAINMAIEALKREQQLLDLINADWKYEGLEIEINNLPSVTSQEPRKGKWIENEDRAGWHCSCCGVDNYYAYSWNCETDKFDFQDKFCPNCGADMREELT